MNYIEEECVREVEVVRDAKATTRLKNSNSKQ